MNIISAVFTGVALSASPSQQADLHASSAPPVQVASIEAAPNFLVTPLTDSDVALYLEVMRGAAEHVTQATGDDRAAIDYMRQTKAGAPAPLGAERSSETAMLERRAADLSSYDETIAGQEGKKARYDAIKSAIEGQASVNPSVQAADAAVLDPHRSEIQALQNQVRGFMNGQ